MKGARLLLENGHQANSRMASGCGSHNFEWVVVANKSNTELHPIRRFESSCWPATNTRVYGYDEETSDAKAGAQIDKNKK